MIPAQALNRTIRLYRKLKNLRKVGKRLGVSHEAIRMRLRKVGEPLMPVGTGQRRRGPRPNRALDAKIRKLRKRGLSHGAIGIMVNRSATTIGKRLGRMPNVPAVDPVKRLATRHGDTFRRAYRMVLSGKSIYRAAKTVGKTMCCVYSWMEQVGLHEVKHFNAAARRRTLAETVRVYERLKSVAATARVLGIGMSTVRQRLDCAGHKTLRPGRPGRAA